MTWKNTELNKIVNEISMTDNDMERVKNKVNTLLNKMKNEKNINFNYTYIGSYSFKTIVNYDDENIDIDCMIIFPKESFKNAIDARKYVLDVLKLYDEQTKSNIKIEEKEKVIQIAFKFNNDEKNYHIDFPIVIDQNGEKKLVLKNGDLEDTEADIINNEFKNAFSSNNLQFHRNVIKLFKRWVKTNANENLKNEIPSIAILQSCIESNKWNHNDILDNLYKNCKNIYLELLNKEFYKLAWKPNNNIFYKKNINNCLSLLERFCNHLDILIKSTNEKKFIKAARCYFLGEDDEEESVYGDKTSGA